MWFWSYFDFFPLFLKFCQNSGIFSKTPEVQVATNHAIEKQKIKVGVCFGNLLKRSNDSIKIHNSSVIPSLWEKLFNVE